MDYEIFNVDCFAWLAERREKSVHACITDPPYGLREYSEAELAKRQAGVGGIWRIPPAIGGHKRRPLPRFTVLTDQDRRRLGEFFVQWGKLLLRVLVPGGHLFVATNPLVSPIVFEALAAAGLERRGELVRLVRTLRGGDRPKGGEAEFPLVTAMPRSAWEPWGLYRRSLEGTLVQNLRAWGTGGLRRASDVAPFCDVIRSTRTPRREMAIAPHPSLKPQAFLRHLVRAALPTGLGLVLDPFMGSGSTVAACAACGVHGIGLELRADYFDLARRAIPALAGLSVEGDRSAPTGAAEIVGSSKATPSARPGAALWPPPARPGPVGPSGSCV